MEAIKEYLHSEDPDYQEGVRLLGEHNRNRNLVQQLQRKENPSTWAKLRYELAKAAGDLSLATLPIPLQSAGALLPDSIAGLHEKLEQLAAERNATSPEAPEFRQLQEQMQQVKAQLTELEADLQPEVADLAELAKQLVPEALTEVEGLTQLMGEVYGRKIAASNTLGDATSRADRQRIVAEIQTYEDQYNALAEKKRLVIERGTPTTEPAAVEETAPTLAELLKDRGNMRSNLSKARKSAEKAKTAEKKSEYEQKAGRLTAELDQLELDIKKLQEQPQA